MKFLIESNGFEDKYFYKTAPIADGEYFDTNRHESSYYTDYYTNTEYMDNKFHTKSSIEYMSPNEYFEICAYLNDRSVDHEKMSISYDKDILNHLKDVILKYKVRFPMTYINYAVPGNKERGAQEGRHRMYVLGELFGWDKKYPVFVINETEEGKKIKENDKIYDIIDSVLEHTNDYTYVDYNSYIEELKYWLDSKLEDFEYDAKYKIKETTHTIDILIKDIKYEIDKQDIEIDPHKNDYDDFNLDDMTDLLDIDDLEN